MVKHPKRLVSTNVQILLRESYEQAYGIYDHKNSKQDHLGLVRYHWCEDSIAGSRLRERLEAFIDRKVGQHLNLSFTQFLEQPSYLCDLQLEVLEKKASETDPEMERLLKEYSEQNKK